jgi:hypothetical protein
MDSNLSRYFEFEIDSRIKNTPGSGLSYANNEIKWRYLDAVCKIILGCGLVAEEMLKGLSSEN